MCGIAGYYRGGSEEILHKMIEEISYRGPDDKGIFCMGEVGLAHRRLSIIDTSSAGHQPMGNEDKSIQVVFNGEIYNYAELKAGLQEKHVFASHTDTEVIIHLYEEIGSEVFSKLSGMFAIALYDSRKNILFLARDRMGKKPLYWQNNGRSFIFGSELKVLMKHPDFRKEIDMESVSKYLTYEYVPTPHSIFRDTYKLEPGTFISYDGKEISKNIFWEPKFLPKASSFESSKEELDLRLERAVKDRLVSDVPIGVFLSGGIDSACVAYYAAKNNKEKIKTFSIGFEESSFDESRYARMVAKHLGTEHHEEILHIQDCIDLVTEIGGMLDEPMADPSIVPTYLLSKFAKQDVTVALGGDGGDELFCGYDTFLAHKMAKYYSYIPSLIREKIIKPAVFSLPTSYVNMSLDFKLKKFVSGYEGNALHRNERWLAAFDEESKQKLLIGNLVLGDTFEDIDRYSGRSDSQETFDMLALLHERMYMMDGVLVKVDRASMMNSLEVRAPFLDSRVVELANHMPTDFKLKGLERKYILKEVMRGKLPDEIIYRRKKGFGMPIGKWIKDDLKPVIEDYLSQDSVTKMGIFDYAFVRSLLDDHYAGKKDNRKQIWTLFVFSMWWRKWMA